MLALKLETMEMRRMTTGDLAFDNCKLMNQDLYELIAVRGILQLCELTIEEMGSTQTKIWTVCHMLAKKNIEMTKIKLVEMDEIALEWSNKILNELVAV